MAQPRPTYGIAVANTVANCTFASRGSSAMCRTVRATSATDVRGRVVRGRGRAGQGSCGSGRGEFRLARVADADLVPDRVECAHHRQRLVLEAAPVRRAGRELLRVAAVPVQHEAVGVEEAVRDVDAALRPGD